MNIFLQQMDGMEILKYSVGSTCDYLSDDTFGNYGFNLGDEDLNLGPFCFGTCWDTCQPPVQTL